MRCLFLHKGHEVLHGHAFPQPFQLHHGEGLGHGIRQKGHGVICQLGIQKRSFHRAFVGAHDGVQQDVAGQHAPAVVCGANHESGGTGGVLGSGVHGLAHSQRIYRRLQLKRIGGAFRLRRGCQRSQVVAVYEGQEPLQVQITVQNDVAVVGTVVAAMIVQKAIVG